LTKESRGVSVKTMKITLTRKTSAWGALRYFTFYKNGVHQGKLFTNVPIEIEADPGDVLTFYEPIKLEPAFIER
jgi:hypothetical protein